MSRTNSRGKRVDNFSHTPLEAGPLPQSDFTRQRQGRSRADSRYSPSRGYQLLGVRAARAWCHPLVVWDFRADLASRVSLQQDDINKIILRNNKKEPVIDMEIQLDPRATRGCPNHEKWYSCPALCMCVCVCVCVCASVRACVRSYVRAREHARAQGWIKKCEESQYAALV